MPTLMSALRSIRKNPPKDAKQSKTVAAPTGPVEVVQYAMADPQAAGFGPVVAALDDIVQQALWRKGKTAIGAPFQSFGAFAVAPAPYGLGIRCVQAARVARHALFENKLFGPWTEVLELIARKPGRPSTIVNHENFRYYSVPNAMTSRDRLLLTLKREHHDYFVRVCNGKCSPYKAGIEAGLVVARKTDRLRFGVCDFQGAIQLRRKPQARLLRELFRALTIDAQCALIARELEPGLGTNLAESWRAQHTPSDPRHTSGS